MQRTACMLLLALAPLTPGCHSPAAPTEKSHGGDLGMHAPAPVQVTPCAQLGAVGQWEEITPPQFLQIHGASPDGGAKDTPLSQALGVDPIDQSVYVSGFTWNGGSTGLLKSSDCGATWTKVSTGRNGAALDTGAQWALQIDPGSPQTMYVANGYGSPPSLFKSVNGGVDWDDLFPAGSEVNQAVPNSFTQAVGMDATDPRHLVVTFHENCNAPHAPMCMAETHDAGATWRIFDGPAAATGWAEASGVFVIGPTSWILSSPQLWGVFYTGDGGKSWHEVVTGPAYSDYTSSATIATDGALYLGVANTGIFVSRADATHPLGSSFTAIPQSPQASTLASDGVSLFASYSWDSGGQPIWSAPLADTAKWTHVGTPAIPRGANNLVYEAAHHLLYSPNDAFGVWRVVTR